MTGKDFDKSQLLVFSKFIRQYQSALKEVKVGEYLNRKQIYEVLHFLGYVDEFKNDQSIEMCYSIAYLLSVRPEHKISVSTENLFQFLKIIGNIPDVQTKHFEREAQGLNPDSNICRKKQDNQPPIVALRIGSFDQLNNDKWTIDDEERLQVQKIFGCMNLKRISRMNIEADVLKEKTQINTQLNQQITFKPQILQKSRSLAQSRGKKLEISQKNSRVEDRLLANRSLQQSRLQVEVHKSIEKQMQQCSFQPKTNTPKRKILSYSLTKYVDSLNTSCQQNKQNEKSMSNVSFQDKSRSSLGNSMIGEKLMLRGKEYQNHLNQLKNQYRSEIEAIDFKECTFQPKLCKKAYNRNGQGVGINRNLQSKKNIQRTTEKSIERMKEGFERRQFERAVKERGYPKNVEWTKFMSEKNSRSKTDQNHKKMQILCIDLKIFNETKKIKVFEGDSLEKVAENICQQNKVPKQFWHRVADLLKSEIARCEQVSLKPNGKVFLRKALQA